MCGCALPFPIKRGFRLNVHNWPRDAWDQTPPCRLECVAADA